MVLGPRLGSIFARDDKEKGGLPAGHNLLVAAVGGFLLWFGWYGFNPGSTLSAMDMQGIGRVAANTTLAACAGGFTAMLAALWFGPTKGKFDLAFTINGFLSRFSCYYLPLLLGKPARFYHVRCYCRLHHIWWCLFIEWFRIDDPVGAVSVHGLTVSGVLYH
jgi:Amt family ammonium transporter